MKQYASKDYYGLLGLTYEATTEEIKKAFRKATVKYHPDVNKNGEKIFMEIKEAYEVLIAPNERKNYDFVKGYDIKRQAKQREKNKKNTYNYSNSQTNTQTNSQQTKTNSSKSEKKYYKYDYSNAYKQNTETREDPEPKYQQTRQGEKQKDKNFSDTLSDIVGNLFSKNKSHKKTEEEKPQDGADITMPVEISYKEAITGTNRKINVLHTEVCPICQGKKFINGNGCKYCRGTGEVSLHKKLNVKIPANTTNNKKIRLIGEGTKGLKGGKNGNLYLVIKITDDSYFKFDGNNVLSEVEITPYDAALGGEKEIKTLSGFAKLKIPQGTSSGQKFRLANEGLFDENSKTKGDQIVTIKIKVSDNLSEREKQLYEELKNISKGK